MKEVWKDIKGYEGIYQVSNLGRVKSLSRFKDHPNGGVSLIKERVLKSAKSKGYPTVRFSKKGKYKTQKVHRLVANAFLPNPLNKPSVNHKDLNKENNKITNLEWCSHRENTSHYFLNVKTESKYIGVCLSRNKKWVAYIHKNGKRKHLGVFESEIKASKRYQKELKSLL